MGNRMLCLFNCKNGIFLFLQSADKRRSGSNMFPWNKMFRTERDFCKLWARFPESVEWFRCNTAKINLFYPRSIRRPEYGSDVVETAYIVQKNDHIVSLYPPFDGVKRGYYYENGPSNVT